MTRQSLAPTSSVFYRIVSSLFANRFVLLGVHFLPTCGTMITASTNVLDNYVAPMMAGRAEYSRDTSLGLMPPLYGRTAHAYALELGLFTPKSPPYPQSALLLGGGIGCFSYCRLRGSRRLVDAATTVKSRYLSNSMPSRVYRSR